MGDGEDGGDVGLRQAAGLVVEERGEFGGDEGGEGAGEGCGGVAGGARCFDFFAGCAEPEEGGRDAVVAHGDAAECAEHGEFEAEAAGGAADVDAGRRAGGETQEAGGVALDVVEAFAGKGVQRGGHLAAGVDAVDGFGAGQHAGDAVECAQEQAAQVVFVGAGADAQAHVARGLVVLDGADGVAHGGEGGGCGEEVDAIDRAGVDHVSLALPCAPGAASEQLHGGGQRRHGGDGDVARCGGEDGARVFVAGDGAEVAGVEDEEEGYVARSHGGAEVGVGGCREITGECIGAAFGGRADADVAEVGGGGDGAGEGDLLGAEPEEGGGGGRGCGEEVHGVQDSRKRWGERASERASEGKSGRNHAVVGWEVACAFASLAAGLGAALAMISLCGGAIAVAGCKASC